MFLCLHKLKHATRQLILFRKVITYNDGYTKTVTNK